MNSLTVIGRVNQVGYYGDCIPTLVILFAKDDNSKALFPSGERLEMTLVVEGERYRAGLRTTDKMRDVKICPDLLDTEGRELRFADILLKMGLVQKNKVQLVLNSDTVTLEKFG